MTEAQQIAAWLDDAVLARFWNAVQVGGEDECWPWLLSKSRFGYGRMAINRQTLAATHIALATVGKLRPSRKHQALHSCDNAQCVNPKHLRWGLHMDNMRDKIERGRCARMFGASNSNAMPDTPANRLKKAHIVSSNLSMKKLADFYGVGTTIIWAIKNGRKWSHIPLPERGEWKEQDDGR